MNNLESLAYLAKDRIGKKNPFPHLDGLPSNKYGCKWGLTDLYPEDESILRAAIENKQTFDTGWIGCKKEIRSFRIISDGKKVTIQASDEIDEIEDLIYDALDNDEELTDETIEMLLDWWYESDLATESITESTIPMTTYEKIMEELSKLEDSAAAINNTTFEIVKSWVKEAIQIQKEFDNATTD